MRIAGGIYLEVCASPPSSLLLGSGGRAALALTSLVDNVALDAFGPQDSGDDASERFASAGIALTLHRSAAILEFHYLHTLARPRLQPMEVPWAGSVDVHGEVILRFGCIEGDFRCVADTAVYDPQSSRPAEFGANGSAARRLALVVNQREFEMLAGLPFARELAGDYARSRGLEVLVVKAGPAGAWVFNRTGAVEHVPAYRTDGIAKIGSGDLFSAAFAYWWAIAGKDATSAADAASRHAADYVSDRRLPLRAAPLAWEPAPTPTRKKVVILAVPSTGLLADWLVSEALASLADVGFEIAGVFRRMPTDFDARMGAADLLVVLPVGDLSWGSTACAVASKLGRRAVALVGNGEEGLIAAAAAVDATVHWDLATLAYASAWALADDAISHGI